MTEMQSDFEDWLKEFRGDRPEKMPASLEYMAWLTWQKAWQASRAAIVVKTGTMKDPSYEATGMVYLDSVEKALDDAGGWL